MQKSTTFTASDRLITLMTPTVTFIGQHVYPGIEKLLRERPTAQFKNVVSPIRMLLFSESKRDLNDS